MTKGAFTKLWVSTLITLVLLVTGVSLAASWPINVNPPKDTQKDAPIKFGEGGTVTTVINLTDRKITEGKVLVPEGKVVDPSKQTDEILYEINLLWSEHENSKGSSKGVSFIGDLEFSHEVLNLDESVKHLVKVEPSADTIFFNKQKEVTLKITLSIPKDKEEYDLIKGKELIITLTIEVIDPKEHY